VVNTRDVCGVKKKKKEEALVPRSMTLPMKGLSWMGTRMKVEFRLAMYTINRGSVAYGHPR
jgi:hypothetical protein